MKPKPLLPTSDEVDRRLRIVAELRNLCLSLGKARPVKHSPSSETEAPSKIDPATTGS